MTAPGGSGPDSTDEVRRHPSLLKAAAWVPDTDDNLAHRDTLEQRAVDWVRQQADSQDVDIVVFCNARKAVDDIGPIAELACRTAVSYPLDRSQYQRPVSAVLAVRPDARSLHQAARLARRSSLVVIESLHSLRLAGWALAVGAVDLSPRPEPAPALTAQARRALDSALLFTGRNNWTGSPEKQHARRVLRDVVQSGELDADLAVGYALAHTGVSELGAKNLREIIEGL